MRDKPTIRKDIEVARKAYRINIMPYHRERIMFNRYPPKWTKRLPYREIICVLSRDQLSHRQLCGVLELAKLGDNEYNEALSVLDRMGRCLRHEREAALKLMNLRIELRRFLRAEDAMSEILRFFKPGGGFENFKHAWEDYLYEL